MMISLCYLMILRIVGWSYQLAVASPTFNVKSSNCHSQFINEVFNKKHKNDLNPQKYQANLETIKFFFMFLCFYVLICILLPRSGTLCDSRHTVSLLVINKPIVNKDGKSWHVSRSSVVVLFINLP